MFRTQCTNVAIDHFHLSVDLFAAGRVYLTMSDVHLLHCFKHFLSCYDFTPFPVLYFGAQSCIFGRQ